MCHKKHFRQKSICSLCIAVIMFAMMLPGCSTGIDVNGESSVTASEAVGSSDTSASDEPVDENTRGNTVGNIVNGGRVAQQGDWIYYFHYSSNISSENENLDDDNEDAMDNENPNVGVYVPRKYVCGIYKSHIDGSEKIPIGYIGAFKPCRIFGVVGDWIYLTVSPRIEFYTSGYLYRMHTDGTDGTQLNDDNSNYVNVVGSWLYYVNESDGGRLYKMSTDGTEKTKINDDESSYLNAVDGWLYFSNISDGGCIYKLRLDGTGETKINDDESSYLNATDGWVYYSNASDGNKLYKIRTDGTERTKLSDDDSSAINVANGWVYYNNRYSTGVVLGGQEDYDNQIYKIRIDGTARTLVYADTIGSCLISVMGDWIYYCGAGKSYDSPLHGIRTDGTEIQTIE